MAALPSLRPSVFSRKQTTKQYKKEVNHAAYRSCRCDYKQGEYHIFLYAISDYNKLHADAA